MLRLVRRFTVHSYEVDVPGHRPAGARRLPRRQRASTPRSSGGAWTRSFDAGSVGDGPAAGHHPRAHPAGGRARRHHLALGIDRRAAVRGFSVAVDGAGDRAQRRGSSSTSPRGAVRPDGVPASTGPASSRSPLRRASPSRPPTRGRRFDVHYADIDRTCANHAGYLSWALGASGTWRASRPCSIEASYLAECRHGDTVLGRVAEEDGAWVHALVREGDGKELARVRTRWTGR
jgi:hypothetical protein